jgi:hypothetical protein
MCSTGFRGFIYYPKGEGEGERKRKKWSGMTLDCWMVVERYPTLKEEVGGTIPGCEISSLRDGNLARWFIVSCALVMACRPSVSTEKEKSYNV